MDPLNVGVSPVPPPRSPYGARQQRVVTPPGQDILPPEALMALLRDTSVEDEVQQAIKLMRGEQSDLAAMGSIGTPRMRQYAQMMQGPAMQAFQAETKGAEDRALKRSLAAAGLMGKNRRGSDFAPSRRGRIDTDEFGNRVWVNYEDQSVTPLGYKAPRPMTTGDSNLINDAVQIDRALGRLVDTFDLSFANSKLPAFLASGYVRAQQELGDYADKVGGSSEEARWWSEFQQLVELPRRHAIFGAQLTEGEKASWRAAATIKPGIAPDQLLRNIEILQSIQQDVIARVGAKAKAQGSNPAAVDALSVPRPLPGGRGKVATPPPAAPAVGPPPGAKVLGKYNPATQQIE
jgi:hypothetical protein